jgi:hypothetical protein
MSAVKAPRELRFFARKCIDDITTRSRDAEIATGIWVAERHVGPRSVTWLDPDEPLAVRVSQYFDAAAQRPAYMAISQVITMGPTAAAPALARAAQRSRQPEGDFSNAEAKMLYSAGVASSGLVLQAFDRLGWAWMRTCEVEDLLTGRGFRPSLALAGHEYIPRVRALLTGGRPLRGEDCGA